MLFNNLIVKKSMKNVSASNGTIHIYIKKNQDNTPTGNHNTQVKEHKP